MFKKVLATVLLSCSILAGSCIMSCNTASAQDVYAGEQTKQGLTQTYYIDNTSVAWGGNGTMVNVLAKTVQEGKSMGYIHYHFYKNNLDEWMCMPDHSSKNMGKVANVRAWQIILNACYRYL